MRRSPAARLGVVVAIIAWVGFAAWTLSVAPEPTLAIASQAAVNLLIIVVGSIIVLRSDQPLIGFLLLGMGVGFQAGLIAAAVEELSAAGESPLSLAATVGGNVIGLSVGFLIVLLFVYPTGRPISRRWGLITIGVVSVFLLATVAQAVLDLASRDQISPTDDLIWYPVTLALMFVGLGSLVARFRRAVAVERAQIAWLAYAIALAFSIYVVAGISGVDDETFLVVDAIATALTPLAILVAITRYRLFEIGRIVNRTVVYGAVVAALAVVFALGAVWLPTQLPTGNSNLAVAGTTLLVFVLFQPLRRRVQALVDKRFNRSRYDAEQVAQSLSGQLRDEVDPDVVSATWADTVAQVVEPATVAVWVREDDNKSPSVTGSVAIESNS